MDRIRKKFIFKGRVQHVGFRYTARMTANALGLSGYAENLCNGDVLQSKNIGKDLTQGLKTIIGGELGAYTQMNNERCSHSVTDFI